MRKVPHPISNKPLVHPPEELRLTPQEIVVRLAALEPDQFSCNLKSLHELRDLVKAARKLI